MNGRRIRWDATFPQRWGSDPDASATLYPTPPLKRDPGIQRGPCFTCAASLFISGAIVRKAATALRKRIQLLY